MQRRVSQYFYPYTNSQPASVDVAGPRKIIHFPVRILLISISCDWNSPRKRPVSRSRPGWAPVRIARCSYPTEVANLIRTKAHSSIFFVLCFCPATLLLVVWRSNGARNRLSRWTSRRTEAGRQKADPVGHVILMEVWFLACFRPAFGTLREATVLDRLESKTAGTRRCALFFWPICFPHMTDFD